ncbi:hypothetical protein N7512_008376 [Penicillium capsulatum]|nr:hypothetical protein N7512_008376 [Penicillium capsulatum]
MCIWPEELEHLQSKSSGAVSLYENTAENKQDDRMNTSLDIFQVACAQPRPRLYPELSIKISANLYHYLDHTADTFQALTPAPHRSRWGGLVLEQAKEFPFVMNALDAIIALHRDHLSSKDAPHHIENAYSSRAASIQEFRSTVSDITPINASGTLTLSSSTLFCVETPHQTCPDRYGYRYHT